MSIFDRSGRRQAEWNAQATAWSMSAAMPYIENIERTADRLLVKALKARVLAAMLNMRALVGGKETVDGLSRSGDWKHIQPTHAQEAARCFLAVHLMSPEVLSLLGSPGELDAGKFLAMLDGLTGPTDWTADFYRFALAYFISYRGAKYWAESIVPFIIAPTVRGSLPDLSSATTVLSRRMDNGSQESDGSLADLLRLIPSADASILDRTANPAVVLQLMNVGDTMRRMVSVFDRSDTLGAPASSFMRQWAVTGSFLNVSAERSA